MRLRPHHLLCTQGYSGKGYNDEFVANMTAITNRLCGDRNSTVHIVFSTDDICACCPQMTGIDCCKHNEKVKRYDQKVIDYFGIEERSYIYEEIINEINSKMTESIMDDICGDCGWYPMSACKKNILGE
ncbi:DUF1284 domain-containing protein [Oscillospiraceae bacterium PP1C4]